MKNFKKKIILSVAILSTFGLFGAIVIFAAGPATVNLGTAGDFAILSKAGITNVPTSAVTGNVGSSPITGAFIGITCGEVTGIIYSADAAGPLPCRVTDSSLLTTAVSDMEAAYTDTATRTPAIGPNLNIGGGTVSTQTLTPGLYTWTSPVTITGDITLSGSSTDIWIFQINGTLSIDANVDIILTGGASPENVFWQTTQTVNLMAGSHFEGNILSQTDIAMRSGATLNGRALAQTEVTLIANTIIIPTDSVPESDDTESSGGSSSGGMIYGCKDPAALNYNYFSSSNPSLCQYSTYDSAVISTTTINNNPIVIIPKLPKTGLPPQERDPWYMVIFSHILNIIK